MTPTDPPQTRPTTGSGGRPAGPSQEPVLSGGADHPGVIMPPPLIFLIAMVLGLALGKAVTPLPLMPDELTGWVGPSMIAMAVAVIVICHRRFRWAQTNIRPDRSTTAIIKTGPYRFSRNPLYLSLSLIQVGVGCWFNNLWVVLMLIPALIVLRWGVIAREEAYLEKKFGRAYLDYKASVRRWL